MKSKYTFKSILGLIFLWPFWFFHDPNKRASWNLIKKGFETHEHKFTIFHSSILNGKYLYYKCEHEGCNKCTEIKCEI